MTKDELLTALQVLPTGALQGDHEAIHIEAESFLLEFIDDAEITEAYGAILKWYS